MSFSVCRRWAQEQAGRKKPYSDLWVWIFSPTHNPARGYGPPSGCQLLFSNKADDPSEIKKYGTSLTCWYYLGIAHYSALKPAGHIWPKGFEKEERSGGGSQSLLLGNSDKTRGDGFKLHQGGSETVPLRKVVRHWHRVLREVVESWRCSATMEMWKVGTWFIGHGGDWLTVEVDDLGGLLILNDSTILWFS